WPSLEHSRRLRKPPGPRRSSQESPSLPPVSFSSHSKSLLLCSSRSPLQFGRGLWVVVLQADLRAARGVPETLPITNWLAALCPAPRVLLLQYQCVVVEHPAPQLGISRKPRSIRAHLFQDSHLGVLGFRQSEHDARTEL